MSKALVIGTGKPAGQALEEDLVAAFAAAAGALGYNCHFEKTYGSGVKAVETKQFDAALLYLEGNVSDPGRIIRRLKDRVGIVLVLVSADARRGTDLYHPYFALHCRITEGADCFLAASEQSAAPGRFRQHVIHALAPDQAHNTVLEVSLSRKREQPPVAFIATPYDMLRRTEFQEGVEAALKHLGWTWRIGDRVAGQRSIHDSVCQQILGADVLIANLTGANGNVIYEAGVAAGKNRILMRRHDDRTELPILLTSGMIVPFCGPIDLAQTLYEGLRPTWR